VVVAAASVVVVVASSEVVVVISVKDELISHGNGSVEHKVVVVIASKLVAEPVVSDSVMVVVRSVGNDSI
jgi:hypothetical protein